MSTITTALEGVVEDAAAHLYVWALKDIPQDLRDALAAARDRETSKTGIRILETIHRNVSIADEQKNLVCQDTGIAVYTCRVGEHFPLHPTRIYAALKAGTARRICGSRCGHVKAGWKFWAATSSPSATRRNRSRRSSSPVSISLM